MPGQVPPLRQFSTLSNRTVRFPNRMTPVPADVVEWLEERFPKPRVDSEWLQGCYSWLVNSENLSPTQDFSRFMESAKYQLLESNLTDSMQSHSGLPVDIDQTITTLRGQPVLVQIISITDMDISSIRLEQVRVAREQWRQPISNNVENEVIGHASVADKAIPSYPRERLLLQLSDGMTVIRAMEYRPLTQLTLGVTELGYKMQLLPGTRIYNGLAFLEPDTVKLLGGGNEELEATQLINFERHLAKRLESRASRGIDKNGFN